MSYRQILSSLVAGLALAALPVEAAAQICAGVPNSGRDLTLQGRFVSTEGIDSYGAMVHFNSPGYLSYGAGWLLDDFENEDDNGNTFMAQIAAELDPANRWPVAVCVVAGAQYSEFSTEFSLGDFEDQRFTIVGGVGIGKEIPLTPTVSLGAWAIPGIHYLTAEQEIIAAGFVQRAEDESTGFTARIGGSVRLSRFHITGEYTYFDVEGVEDTFGVSLGYNFGLR